MEGVVSGTPSDWTAYLERSIEHSTRTLDLRSETRKDEAHEKHQMVAGQEQRYITRRL